VGDGDVTVAALPDEHAVRMSAASRAPDAVRVFFMGYSLNVRCGDL
jgi:hypothetical protein